jgi:calcium/calmodulin-dependent protein kinase I
LKVADFGLAICEEEKINEKCGTLLYMAPEILKKKPYDNSIDIWATGVILYILSSGGKHPLHHKNLDNNEYIEKISCVDSWTFTDHFPL